MIDAKTGKRIQDKKKHLPDIGLTSEVEARRQALVASLRAGWCYRLVKHRKYEIYQQGEAS